jgi:hypothetical protein
MSLPPVIWASSGLPPVNNINIHQSWLQEAANILNCKIGSTPFKYLGLPIGANPRRIPTWQP